LGIVAGYHVVGFLLSQVLPDGDFHGGAAGHGPSMAHGGVEVRRGKSSQADSADGETEDALRLGGERKHAQAVQQRPVVIQQQQAERKQMAGSGFTPTHSSLVEAGMDHLLVGALRRTSAPDRDAAAGAVCGFYEAYFGNLHRA
jgi:hypothetical protein